jgi:hypothetical protein
LATLIAVGQFTITDLNDVTVSDTAPTSPAINALWLDTTATPNALKRWDGTEWVIAGVQSSDISTAVGDLNTNIQQQISDLTDTEDSKISSAQTQLSIQQGLIDSKVSQTEFDGLVGDYDPAVDGDLNYKFTELVQASDGINTTISKYTGGGTNLLLNSSALSDLAYWTHTSGNVLYDTDLSGALASGHCFELASPDGAVEGMIGQDVSVVIGKPYVLSFRYKKKNANRAYAQIKDGTRVVTIWQDSTTASTAWTNYPDSQDPNSVVVVFTPVNSTSATITFGTIGTGFLVGDIMFAQNYFPQAWSPNSLEFYRENIIQDINGITISSTDNNWLANYQNDSITMYQQNQTPVVSISPDIAVLPKATINGDTQIGKIKFMVGTGRVDIAVMT